MYVVLEVVVFVQLCVCRGKQMSVLCVAGCVEVNEPQCGTSSPVYSTQEEATLFFFSNTFFSIFLTMNSIETVFDKV